MWSGVANRMSVRLYRPERPWGHAGSHSEMLRRPSRVGVSSSQSPMHSQHCSSSVHCSLRGLRSVVGEHAASPLTPSAGRICWAIRSVLDEPTIGYRTSRIRRPKTISHDDAIAASCTSSRHSRRGREADVLMYPASLSARAVAIANLFAPSCTLGH